MPKKKKVVSPDEIRRFDEAMSRLKSISGCETQVQLAEFLDVRQSSISDAKRRCSIPSDWLFKTWKKTGYSPLWIMDGAECGHVYAVPSLDPFDGPVDGAALRERIEAKVRAELGNMTSDDCMRRIRALHPDAVVKIIYGSAFPAKPAPGPRASVS